MNDKQERKAVFSRDRYPGPAGTRNRKFKSCFLILLAFMLLLAVSCRKVEKEAEKGKGGESKVTSSKSVSGGVSSEAAAPESAAGESAPAAPEASSKSQTVSKSGGTKKLSGTVEKSLPPLSGEESRELNKNPDRGFRQQIIVSVGEIASWGPNKETMTAKASDVIMRRIGATTSMEHITIALVYFYLDAYKDTGITEEGYAALDAIFEALREWNLKARVNFCYQPNRDDIGASEEVTLRDIGSARMKKLINDNKDAIYILGLGFMGAYGEWHSDNPPVDKTKLIEAVAQMCPEDVYIGARLPIYKNLLSISNPAYNRVGFMNDSFFGKLYRGYNSGSGGLDPGTAQWKQCIEESPYTPNDGELYNTPWLINNNVEPADPKLTILALSEHRYTTLSYYHGYCDALANNIPLEQSAMGKWQKVPVTEKILRELGTNVSPQWFKDNGGKTISRNAYEYIRDHLGYRLEARNLIVTGDSGGGGNIDVEMSLVNYGFSAAFNLTSGFAILDKDGKVVSSVEAGTPTDWHPTSPMNYNNRAMLKHTINASLTLPEEAGRYRLAFFLKNTMGQHARLANNIAFADGYNILHTFDI